MPITLSDTITFPFRAGAGIDREQVYQQVDKDDAQDGRLGALETDAGKNQIALATLKQAAVQYHQVLDLTDFNVGQVVRNDNGLFKVTTAGDNQLYVAPGSRVANGVEQRGIVVPGSSWPQAPVIGEYLHAPLAGTAVPVLSCYARRISGNVLHRVELLRALYEAGLGTAWAANADTPLTVVFAGYDDEGNAVADTTGAISTTDSEAVTVMVDGAEYVRWQHAIVTYNPTVNTHLAAFILAAQQAEMRLTLYAATAASAARRVGSFAVKGLTQIHDPDAHQVQHNLDTLRESLPSFAAMQAQIDHLRDLLVDMSLGAARPVFARATNPTTTGAGFAVRTTAWTLTAARALAAANYSAHGTFGDVGDQYVLIRVPHALANGTVILRTISESGAVHDFPMSQLWNVGNTAAVDFKFFSATTPLLGAGVRQLEVLVASTTTHVGTSVFAGRTEGPFVDVQTQGDLDLVSTANLVRTNIDVPAAADVSDDDWYAIWFEHNESAGGTRGTVGTLQRGPFLFRMKQLLNLAPVTSSATNAARPTNGFMRDQGVYWGWGGGSGGANRKLWISNLFAVNDAVLKMGKVR